MHRLAATPERWPIIEDQVRHCSHSISRSVPGSPRVCQNLKHEMQPGEQLDMELNIGGIFVYFICLGIMLGGAAGLMFALRAVKLI